MAHFARVENGIVTQVIVAEQDFIDCGAAGDPSSWIQTSYNTFGGIHLTGGTPLRKNFAGIGFTFDEERNAFIPVKPFPSWILSEQTCLYDPPFPMPCDGKRYKWNEQETIWKEIVKC